MTEPTKRTRRLAGIDIGTLTCRLLIADLTSGHSLKALQSERRILRLGEGVDQTKRLSPAAMDRVIHCLQEWRSVIENHEVEATAVVATSAVRDASNRVEFLARVKAECGLEVELISGEEEARRTLLGIRSGLPVGVTDILALDIGGGSTEFILDRPGQNPITRSIDIGVVRLCERLLRHDPPTEDEVRQAREWITRETKAAVAEMGDYRQATFVGTAGTVTALAAMAQKLSTYEPARIHNYVLKLDTIRELEQTLLSRKKVERIGLPGLEKNREEVIAAGAIIIRTIMETLRQKECLVSDLGLREGVLIESGMRTDKNTDSRMKLKQIQSARSAWRLSNELMQDLVAGTQVYWLLQKQLETRPAREPVPTAVRRMCLAHLIIALSKWSELYKRYRDVISEEVSPVAKSLSREIEARGIIKFRNKVVGHVWDDELKRALTADEIEERLSQVLGGSVDEFLLWINNPTCPNTNTVVGTLERVHDRIKSDWGFTKEDLFT